MIDAVCKLIEDYTVVMVAVLIVIEGVVLACVGLMAYAWGSAVGSAGGRREERQKGHRNFQALIQMLLRSDSSDRREF